VARETGASDDLSTQWRWRGVLAKVLARREDVGPAVALAEEAVAITERSDFADDRAESLADLAEVYGLVSKRDEAAIALRRALDIVEEKGVVPLIERVRGQLATLEAGT